MKFKLGDYALLKISTVTNIMDGDLICSDGTPTWKAEKQSDGRFKLKIVSPVDGSGEHIYAINDYDYEDIEGFSNKLYRLNKKIGWKGRLQ